MLKSTSSWFVFRKLTLFVFSCVRDLTAAYQKISTSVFTAGKGERSSAANWVFTVVTGTASNATSAATAASSLRQQLKSTMFAIGVGGNVAQNVLVSYASSSAYAFNFKAADLITGFATQFVCTNLITTGEMIAPISTPQVRLLYQSQHHQGADVDRV